MAKSPTPCPGRGWHTWSLVSRRDGMKKFRCSGCKQTYESEDDAENDNGIRRGKGRAGPTEIELK